MLCSQIFIFYNKVKIQLNLKFRYMNMRAKRTIDHFQRLYQKKCGQHWIFICVIAGKLIFHQSDQLSKSTLQNNNNYASWIWRSSNQIYHQFLQFFFLVYMVMSLMQPNHIPSVSLIFKFIYSDWQHLFPHISYYENTCNI